MTDARVGHDAYVVRAGFRGLLMPAALLLTWAAAVAIRSYSSVGYIALGVVGVAVLAVFAIEVRKVLLREVAFAVSSNGVYFGPAPGEGGPAELVRWAEICAVELFTERRRNPRGELARRCVGVRGLGAVQTRHTGGPAAAPLPEATERYLRNAGRADLIPGADGTIRRGYRRMDGWTVSRPRLIAAVQRHAPHVPVINGPDWPTTLTWSEASAARKHR